MEKMSLAGHLCCFHWVLLLPAPNRQPLLQTGGPIPFALHDSLPIRNLFKLISLLTLREKVVEVHCKRRKHSVSPLLSSSCYAACLPLFLPSWLVLLPPAPPAPPPASSLSQSFSNSSCNLTKRAFLSEKSSPLPSLNVDQHRSQLHGVRLVNRLLPGPVSTCLHKWDRCPAPASGACARQSYGAQFQF